MKLSIYSIKKTLLETEAEKVTIPTMQGEITVLDNHLPLITLVKKARWHIILRRTNGRKLHFPAVLPKSVRGAKLWF